MSFRIVAEPASGDLRAIQSGYAYRFEAHARETIAWHWSPETRRTGERSWPHLHVGSAVVDSDGPFLPDRFNKLHIPTGIVSLASVVRFAIEELGVVPIRRDWDECLSDAST